MNSLKPEIAFYVVDNEKAAKDLLNLRKTQSLKEKEPEALSPEELLEKMTLEEKQKK